MKVSKVNSLIKSYLEQDQLRTLGLLVVASGTTIQLSCLYQEC